jgi:hypothetical protein
MVWFGNVWLFKKVILPTFFINVFSEKNSAKNLVAAPSDQAAHGCTMPAITVYTVG